LGFISSEVGVDLNDVDGGRVIVGIGCVECFFELFLSIFVGFLRGVLWVVLPIVWDRVIDLCIDEDIFSALYDGNGSRTRIAAHKMGSKRKT
jgi:hypothetical protein